MTASLTLEHVAQLAGVSRSTVSRVVNHHPGVRQQVRERVWQVIDETGYQPHAAARSLVTRRTQVVGVVIPEALTRLLTDPFFSRLLQGVTETCNARHYHLMLSLLSGPARQDEMYRRVVLSGLLDGVIVASTRLDDTLIPRLHQDGIPFVLVGRHSDDRVNYVDVDNIGGARMAVEHLIRLGHRRIATISGPLNMAAGQDRLLGYRQALSAHGIRVEETLIVEGAFDQESGAACMRQLLRAQPTAVFVGSDVMAIGAMRTLRQASLSVPQDVAIIGFDDTPAATTIEPALTTVRQPVSRLGAMAADILLGALESPGDPEPAAHRVVLSTELIIRGSCGALESISATRQDQGKE